MKHEYLKNMVTLSLNSEKCIACGRCVEVCPHGVFRLDRANGPSGKKPAEIIDMDACMECGACKMNCPAGAIEVGAGVGCAAAIIYGMLKKTAPACGCSETSGNGKSGGCCC
jgi:NAD-dependent dihydropyrimidine dehydrogenase PreA subunit